MHMLIIHPQWQLHFWGSIGIGGEVAFGFIFSGCLTFLPHFTHPRIELFVIFLCITLKYFYCWLNTSSKINHQSQPQSCWNVSSLSLAYSYFPMQQLLAVTPYPQTPVSQRNGGNSSTPGESFLSEICIPFSTVGKSLLIFVGQWSNLVIRRSFFSVHIFNKIIYLLNYIYLKKNIPFFAK